MLIYPPNTKKIYKDNTDKIQDSTHIPRPLFGEISGSHELEFIFDYLNSYLFVLSKETVWKDTSIVCVAFVSGKSKTHLIIHIITWSIVTMFQLLFFLQERRYMTVIT
jgi:hypothetical protein